MIDNTRFYYTLNELQDPDALTESFSTLLNYWIGASSFTDNTNTQELYNDVSDLYGEDYIIAIDLYHQRGVVVNRPTVAEIKVDPELTKIVVTQLKKIRHWLNDSQFRYNKLISLYSDGTSANPGWGTKLMNKIESESSVQFNDTPQTTATGLDADTYATTYTKNKSSSDPGTVMQRLSEVRALWQSVYEEWSKEFGKMFVIYNY